MFSLTTKQFGRIMRNIERRHPLESWIKRIKENNKEKIYIKQECVEWLHENYFRRDYLKELEEYKWMLQNQKNNRVIKDTLNFI